MLATSNQFVMEQDVIYVGGGNSANMLAVWRLHGFDKALRAAWNAGVVMAGISAGAICWFEDGVTDSFGMPFRGSTTGSDSCAAHAVRIMMARKSGGRC